MEQTDIKSLTLTELWEEFQGRGEKAFRADQVYQWMHEKLAEDVYVYMIRYFQNIAVPYFLDGQILFCQSDFLSDTDKFFRTQTCFGKLYESGGDFFYFGDVISFCKIPDGI